MISFFRKNNYWYGLIFGLLLPIPFYLIFRVLDAFLQSLHIWNGLQQPYNWILLSIAINFIPMRFYFVKVKFEKTAKGILIISVLLVFAFFILFYNK